ncbi:hypothetical protein [Devosia rhizoryzae]|nr:hypothetical protein [Devosia rhizoryzae]
MSSLFMSIGGAEPHWMQHHMPWLAVLALMFGVWRDEVDAGDEAGLNG